jgi:hypothetical protein
MAETYDVALSFAREDRQVARAIAKALREKGIRVFFDEFAESELWGTDLYQHLKKVFDESKLCIVILSEDYRQNKWTQLEWRNLWAHSNARESFCILPVRIGKAEIGKAEASPVGVVDYRGEETVAKVVAAVERILSNLPEQPSHAPIQRYHVIRRDRGWSLKREGASRAASTHKTQGEAIEAAKQMVVKHAPVELVIHAVDGKIMTREQLKQK